MSLASCSVVSSCRKFTSCINASIPVPLRSVPGSRPIGTKQVFICRYLITQLFVLYAQKRHISLNVCIVDKTTITFLFHFSGEARTTVFVWSTVGPLMHPVIPALVCHHQVTVQQVFVSWVAILEVMLRGWLEGYYQYICAQASLHFNLDKVK